jgi:hypothetical protein
LPDALIDRHVKNQPSRASLKRKLSDPSLKLGTIEYIKTKIQVLEEDNALLIEEQNLGC